MTSNDITTGVFKIPVDNEFLYYYVQSKLVNIRNKLYVPCNAYFERSSENLHSAMLSMYRDGRENSLLLIPNRIMGSYKGVAGIDGVNEPLRYRAFFNQTPFVHVATEGPLLKMGAWHDFIFNQDHITPRIVRIQSWVRCKIQEWKKKRLHLLAILLTKQKTLPADVVSLIASHL